MQKSKIKREKKIIYKKTRKKKRVDEKIDNK